MNQHKFAFRVGVLVLLIAVMAGLMITMCRSRRPRSRTPRPAAP